MKIKAIIVSLGLIITMISGIGVNYVKTTRDEVEIENTIASEEKATGNEVLKVSENEVEQEDKEQVIENIEIEENQSTEETKQAEQKNEEVPVTKETQTSTITQTETSSKNQQAITQTQEQTKSVAETSKQETQTTTQTQSTQEATQTENAYTESDLEYWCVSGGSHHIAGDGANEHGYYSSWDEANQAFLDYTTGWKSVQYKISSCPCGLFYFWAIEY